MTAEILQPLVEIIFIESAAKNRIIHHQENLLYNVGTFANVPYEIYYFAPQHFLYFLPDPQGHESLGLVLPPGCGIVGSSKTSGVHFG